LRFDSQNLGVEPFLPGCGGSVVAVDVGFGVELLIFVLIEFDFG